MCFLMFYSQCLAGRVLLKIDFVFVLHFVAEGRTFFLTSRPDHPKTSCFYTFGRLGPARKSVSKKNTHFVAEWRHFFLETQIWTIGCLQKAGSPEHPRKPRLRTKPRGAGAQTPAQARKPGPRRINPQAHKPISA